MKEHEQEWHEHMHEYTQTHPNTRTMMEWKIIEREDIFTWNVINQGVWRGPTAAGDTQTEKIHFQVSFVNECLDDHVHQAVVKTCSHRSFKKNIILDFRSLHTLLYWNKLLFRKPWINHLGAGNPPPPRLRGFTLLIGGQDTSNNCHLENKRMQLRKKSVISSHFFRRWTTYEWQLKVLWFTDICKSQTILTDTSVMLEMIIALKHFDYYYKATIWYFVISLYRLQNGISSFSRLDSVGY